MKPFENLDVGKDAIRSIKEDLLKICKEKNLRPLDLTQGNPVGAISKEYALQMARLIKKEKEGESFSNAYCSSVGHPAYLEAIADLEKEVNKLDFTADHILAVPGAAVGVSTLLYGLSKERREGEVILLAPYFPPYVTYIEHNKLSSNIIAYDDEFSVLDNIAIKISENTRAIIINSPNNPAGHIYSKHFLEDLGEILNGNDHVLAISDEPYRNVILPDEKMIPVIKNLKYQNTAVVYSFSKEGRIAGCRIGYIALHPDFPDHEKVIAALANSLPERGIVQAHTREQHALSKCKLPLDVDWTDMLDSMDEYLVKLPEIGYETLPAKGGMFVCVRNPKYDGIDLHNRLLEAGVGTVPGVAFGIKDYVRLSMCTDDSKNIDEVLDRLEKV